MQFVRNFCFTLNNYTQEEEDDIKKIHHEYIIYGKEIGEEGTPHLQGYIELTKKMRFSSVKKLMPRAHIEARRGTQQQAIDYCKKEGNFIELGICKNQGHRTDLDTVRRTALEGGMREVTAIANLQGIQVAQKFLTYNEPARDWKPEVKWFWGTTGTGKSKTAREELGEDIYTKNDGTKWWDGYDGHEDVIIDDFRPSWWNITEMLSLLDRYEKRVEVKGGWRQLRARRIIITSALAPNACYTNTGEAIQQLLRRIDEVRQFVPNVPEVARVILEPCLEDNIEDLPEDLLNI